MRAALLMVGLAACAGEAPADRGCVEDGGACCRGHRPLANGRCQPAGVPAERCAEGFVAARGGCFPVLPPLPCALGMIATPGDEACRAIMECGEGTWGELPVDDATVFVDQAFVGVSDGSAARPWTTVRGAVDAAPDDALVAIAAGDYREQLVVTRSLRLWGRCPAMVTLARPLEVVDSNATVRVHDVPRLEIGGVSFVGAGEGEVVWGVRASLVEELVVERAAFHSFAVDGAGVIAAAGVEAVRVREVAMDGLLNGVICESGALTLERSMLRDAAAVSFGAFVMSETVVLESKYGVSAVGETTHFDASVWLGALLNVEPSSGRALVERSYVAAAHGDVQLDNPVLAFGGATDFDAMT